MGPLPAGILDYALTGTLVGGLPGPAVRLESLGELRSGLVRTCLPRKGGVEGVSSAHPHVGACCIPHSEGADVAPGPLGQARRLC